MSEDYTYTAEPTRAQLAARVQELERELSQADNNTVALAARNAELRARLDAVPVEAIGHENLDSNGQQYTWQVFGLEGHENIFGNGFLYKSRSAPVEADEYKHMRERAEASEAALIKSRLRVEAADNRANQYLQLTGTQASEIKHLQEQLAAVPVKILREDYHKRFGTRELRWWPEWALPIGRWLFPEAQPASQDGDTDAPLTLAAIDEDGDE